MNYNKCSCIIYDISTAMFVYPPFSTFRDSVSTSLFEDSFYGTRNPLRHVLLTTKDAKEKPELNKYFHIYILKGTSCNFVTFIVIDVVVLCAEL